LGQNLREISPSEAYMLSEQQKSIAANRFVQDIWHFCRAGRKTALPLKESELADVRAALVNNDRSAFRMAYCSLVANVGIRCIDPNSSAFIADLTKFYTNYVENFPIPAERESFDGFARLLADRARADGYVEVAYNACCPLTGRYLMGFDFTIQPTSRTAHLIYCFLAPYARGLGFSKVLLSEIMRLSNLHMLNYPSLYPGDVIITFEKNILQEMSLPEILLDSCGIDIDEPPVANQDLSRSGIDQSVRDLIWDSLGAKIIDYNYIQSSLDGIVKIDVEEQRRLVVRFLNTDPGMTTRENEIAERALRLAVGSKDPGCQLLNLCAFVPPGTADLDSSRVCEAMKCFQGISVIKDEKAIEQDAYFAASMADLIQRSRSGRIALKKIQPYCGDISNLKSFADAAYLTHALLRNTKWDELRSCPEMKYADWIKFKRHLLERDAQLDR
jgi:hypothetical protein